MTTAYSGITGNAFSGANDMDVYDWNIDPKIADVDTSTTADAGWRDSTGSLKGVEGSFDFFYNIAKSPFSSGVGMYPGLEPTLKLYTGGGDWFTGVGLITGVSFKQKVDDMCRCTATFKSKGVWTLPGQ